MCDDEDCWRDRPEFEEGYAARVADPFSDLDNPYSPDLAAEAWAAFQAGEEKAREDMRSTIGGPYVP